MAPAARPAHPSRVVRCTRKWVALHLNKIIRYLGPCPKSPIFAVAVLRIAPLLFVYCCLCCLCNKLARHWFPPKLPHTEHAAASGHPRELPGSLPGSSRWKKRPGRITVMVMYIAPACSSACTTGAHLCICRPIGGHPSSSSRATLLYCLPPAEG